MKKIIVILIIFLLLSTGFLSFANADTDTETKASLQQNSKPENLNQFIKKQSQQYTINKINPIFIFGNDLPGRYDPFFEMTEIKEFGQTVYGITKIDFNDDGHLDFIASWRKENSYLGGISVFLNQEHNVFSEILLMNNEELPIDPIKDDEVIPTIDDLEAADFDGDGDIDLFVASNEYEITGLPVFTNGTGFILFNDGANHFTEWEQIFVHTPITDPRDEKRIHPEITTADFDNDGDIDFLVGDNSGLVEFYVNDGNGNFSSKSVSDFGGTKSWGVASADFDNDGDIDFVVTQSDSVMGGRVCLKYNDGTDSCFDHNNWLKIADLPAKESYFASAAGFARGSLSTIDYNSDDVTDVVFGGSGNIVLFIQKENQDFVPFTGGRLPAFARNDGLGWSADSLRLGGLEVGDFNDDGLDDLIVGGLQGFVRLLTNQFSLVDIVQPDHASVFVDDEVRVWTIPLYSFLKYGTSFVFGDLTVHTDELEPLSKVEFYLDDKLVFTDEETPFEWEWNRFSFGRHTVKAQAYDLEGNPGGFDTARVWKFL